MDPRLRAAALGLKQKSGFVVKPIRKGIFPHAKLKQRLVGRVNATSMQKSITVNVDSFRWHNKVQKMVRKTSKVMAHDEAEEAREGDLVEIIHCRPRSKHKHHQLSRILKRFPQVGQMGSPTDIEARSAVLEERLEAAKADPLLQQAQKLYPFTKPGLAHLKKIPTRKAALMKTERDGQKQE